MKGPGMRLDLDVRRLWRCPACSTERHAPGHVTFVRCHFCKEHPAMVLVEHRRRDREPPPPLDTIIELHPDDVDAPAFVPVHLREPEEPPQAETIAEILTEPTAIDSDAVETNCVEDVDEAPPAASPEAVDPAAESQPRKKKKRRGRRQRRRNRSSDPVETGNSDPAAPAPAAAPPDADESFGAGIAN